MKRGIMNATEGLFPIAPAITLRPHFATVRGDLAADRLWLKVGPSVPSRSGLKLH
jgi:hypothetical protein